LFLVIHQKRRDSMPTQRGFVQKIEVGRAGLVRVFIIHADDGSNGIYVIRDLDADPERFNERLSALGILRDAMNRAEPVEVEFIEGEAGEEIQVAARISRDALAPLRKVEQVAGLVVDILLYSENGATAIGEKHDLARVTILSHEITAVSLVLDLQAPERLVVNEQFEMLRDAQVMGRPVRLLVDTLVETSPQVESTTRSENIIQGESKRHIIGVADDYNFSAFGRDRTVELNGFVESLSLIGLPLLKNNRLASNFASVRFTTAPEFVGGGNVVGLNPFQPTTFDLLVPKNSLTYDLFQAGLCDNLRMRVSAVMVSAGGKSPGTTGEGKVEGTVVMGQNTTKSGANNPGTSNQEIMMVSEQSMSIVTHDSGDANFGIALFAELVAPLASASRPVWISIARESLDLGPDGYKCTTGLPSSDLTPLSLRDLRIPYPAVWRGLGCFNPGVYRFQLKLPTTFKINVDGEPLCLHDSTETGIKLAHACLHGEHEVTLEIDAWICDYEFVMDVYRLR
jgi:hypothetical protein